ncbi:hypothetical protein KP509_26G072200 [Ceratopteris richardii]|uniref:Tetratricopeptide repeat protein n=1 Tax=Ceratopteris richardii TaxID=49495 RepID=A0A8T2RPL3_CERRI|nr:hypothetical protein KP509_26G072200 [Ceratopteris richardii]
MDHLGLTVERQILSLESSSYHRSGFQISSRSLSFKYFKPLRRYPRTCLSEEEKRSGRLLITFRRLSQPMGYTRSSSFQLQNLQHNLQELPEKLESGKPSYLISDVFKALGRAFWILLVGLSVTSPAHARSVTLSRTEALAAENKTHNIGTVKSENGSFDSNTTRADGSLLQDKANDSAEHFLSDDSGYPQAFEERLELGEAFWKGIPTPEGSLLYKIKAHLDSNPGDSWVLEALLRIVLKQKDMLRALTVLETLLEIQPDNLEWKFLKARTHEYLGETLMAQNEYEELLNLRPFSARFLQGLAKVMNKAGQKEEALELIQNAFDQACSEGKDVEAKDLRVLLSQFYIQLGKFEDALQHLTSMIEQDPHDFRPYLCQTTVQSWQQA